MSFLSSNSYLPVRILAGLAVFAILALLDLRRHGRRATRWREYLFLFLCVAVAMIYGVLNDQVSVTISWEYFYYGKEQSVFLGPNVPPAELALRLRAAVVGMMATWSVGLLIGAVLLIANNPMKRFPQLSYRQLAVSLPIALGITVVCAAVGSALGYHGLLDWVQADFAQLRADNMWRPARFITAWCEHLGSYAGGLIGLVVATARVIVLRRAGAPLPSI